MNNVDVAFRYNSALFTLHLPYAFEKLTLPKLKKLFKLMMTDWRTEEKAEPISTTYTALTDYVDETKQEWADATKAFQQWYAGTRYHKKMLAAVKSAEAKYERAQKLLSFFEETRNTYLN